MKNEMATEMARVAAKQSHFPLQILLLLVLLPAPANSFHCYHHHYPPLLKSVLQRWRTGVMTASSLPPHGIHRHLTRGKGENSLVVVAVVVVVARGYEQTSRARS